MSFKASVLILIYFFLNLSINRVKSDFADSNPELMEYIRTHGGNQDSRIINGLTAERGQFPYNVFFITIYGEQNKTYLACGGNIIKMNWIMTAAHCIIDALSGIVYAGIVDLVNGPASYKANFTRSQMFFHAEYSGRNFQNDIALIKLTDTIPCGKNVSIIDLPCNCESLYILDDIYAVVAGFGLTKINDTKISTTLKYTDIKIISQCECMKINNIITNGVLCTVANSFRATCNGDSGSGLVAEISGRKILVGIASYVNKFCSLENGGLQAYTRVSFYLNWIHDILRSN